MKKKIGLPTGKVDKIDYFSKLKYPTYDYFTFVLRFENVFLSLLTLEDLVLYGPDIVEKTQQINQQFTPKKFMSKHLPKNIPEEILSDIVNFVVLIYSSMRGKYFAIKLFYKNSGLKVNTRKLQAVLSNPKH